MDYDIDGSIRYVSEPEYKALYSWCLQEFDKDGTQIGPNQIPWHHGLYLTITSLSVGASVSGNLHTEDWEADRLESRLNESIYGKARSGRFQEGEWLDVISFSMFGTSRSIREFTVRISKASTDHADEHCNIWGCVSYTAEVDFSYLTTDDTVEITIRVSDDKFQRLTSMIALHGITNILLYLRGVQGFYAEWSPSVRTSSIKILCPGQEQALLGYEEGQTAPPRLGTVHQYELRVQRTYDVKSATGVRGGVDAQSWSEIDESLKRWTESLSPGQTGSNPSQYQRVTAEIGRSVAGYSKLNGESVSQFSERLGDAIDVLHSIMYSLRETPRNRLDRDDELKEAKQVIWRHGQALSVFQEGFESEHARALNVELLEEEVQKYLMRPWMESESLEWIMVDALAFQSVTAFGEELKKNSPGPVSFLGGNVAYYTAKGNVAQMRWKLTQYALATFALKVAVFVGVPAWIGWHYWNNNEQSVVLIGGTIYLSLTIMYVVITSIRRLLLKKPKTWAEKHQDLLPDMLSTYERLRPGVVSPTLMLERIAETTRRGAPWRSGVFALLQRAATRDPAIWGDRGWYEYQRW